MSYLSIRRLPSKIDEIIVREARRQHTTKTEVVIHALEKAFGLDRKKSKKRDLRSFFGKMSKNEYKQFQNATESFNQIDSELWK